MTQRRRRQAVQTKVKTHPQDQPTLLTSNRKLWIALGLISLNVLIYAQVLNYDFVHFDDGDYVYANPNVIAGFTWHGLWWALTAQDQGNWHPLTWLAHMLDVQLFGLNPGGHHAINVLLHILNSLILFSLLQHVTADLGRSAFVAAIFAVHPLHVESVAWVAERKDVLSTLFGMLTIWAYVAYIRGPRWSRYLPILVFYVLGLMAKPMLVTLPFLLLLLDYWPLRRDRKAVLSSLVREKIPLMILAAGSSVITFIAQRGGHAVSGLDALPIDVRVKNALTSYVEYLWKIVWPARLAAFYPYSPQRLESWVLVLSALIVLSCLAIALARRYAYIFVGWFWFVGTLVPVIGLVQVGRQSMADRYMYVPLIGVLIIVAWGLPDILQWLPHRKVILGVMAGLVILANGIAAWAQVQYWKNSFVLWNHALEVTSGNYFAHYALAGELGDQGKHEEAISHLTESLRINPNYAEAQYNLGVELVDLQKWDEASIHFSEAIRLDPNHASAHNNLANIFLANGRLSEAVSEYTEALRISPDYVDARTNLANALLQLGRPEDARRELSKVLSINPTHPNALELMRQLHVE